MSRRPQVGQRLVVRIRTGRQAASGNPQLTDIVGVLEEIRPARSDQPETWHLRRRDGSVVDVNSVNIVAVKAIPERAARLDRAGQISVEALEEIAARGWQPLESADLGGWRLRAAEGFTGRANSVLPLGEPGRSMAAALRHVQSWYDSRRLTAQFQVPLPWQAHLDETLGDLGWTAKNRTRVMVADTAKALMTSHPKSDLPSVQWSAQPSTAWLTACRYRGAALPAIASAVMTNADEPIFARVPDHANPDGPLLAVGRAAINDGWIGITGLEVAAASRRGGLGKHIVRALLDHACNRGIRHAYLQVAVENQDAHDLYSAMGFREHHTYVYRVSPGVQ